MNHKSTAVTRTGKETEIDDITEFWQQETLNLPPTFFINQESWPQKT